MPPEEKDSGQKNTPIDQEQFQEPGVGSPGQDSEEVRRANVEIGKRTTTPEAPALLVSSLRRRLALGKLSARSAIRGAAARIAATVAPDAKRHEIVSQVQVRTAEDVARELGNMKGAIMKLGQLASFVALNLSDDVRAPLTSLQQSAPPMSWELVRSQLEAELGEDILAAFARIDPNPAAAASIGQVHKGVLKDGTEVAIKIQYPGVDKAIETDLQNAWVLKRLIAQVFPRVNADAVFEEFRERLSEELDYRNEAANHALMEAAWADDDVVVIPHAFEELTTKRVLVTRWYEGRKFDDVWSAPQDEKNRIAREIYRFAQTCVGTLGYFSGDPHPGNYIFLDDGRIVFLDFGCVKFLDKATLGRLRRIVEAVRSGDFAEASEAMRDAGYITSEVTDQQARRVYDFLEALIKPVVRDQVFRFQPSGQREVARRLVGDRDGNAETAVRSLWNLPKDLVYFNRLNLGLAAILASLQAEANWYRIYESAWAPVAEWVQGHRQATATPHEQPSEGLN